jgi:transcriptional regulator with PAS, ATPase and Fis domain
MPDYPWFDEFPGAITITDANGIIIDMNDMAINDVFKESGGAELIGKNVLDCHPESARRQIESMLVSQQKNVYTIEKGGKKIFVYETPWYKNGVYSGVVELYLEIPFEIPNHIRDK